DVAGEGELDVLARGARVALEQGVRRDQEARGAEAALRAVLLVEGLLHRGESLGRPEPLDRRHLGAVERRERQQARAPRLAVDEDGARAAAALLAAGLGARDRELLAQHLEERCQR